MDITSVIGLSKNAGKTTLLNKLIEGISDSSQSIGLASIGVDGERKDAWTDETKPDIFVPEGTIVATTSIGLKAGTADWKILERLNISSSAGEVYLAQANQAGSVMLIGTSMLDHISKVKIAFKKYDIDHFLIDGAYDRLSSANPSFADQIYIVIGASLHHDEASFYKAIKERLYPFFIPTIENDEILNEAKRFDPNTNLLIKKSKQWEQLPRNQLFLDESILTGEIDWMFLPGVLTENMFLKMLKQKKTWNLVLQHGLKSFVPSSLIQLWEKRGGTIRVLYPMNIVGVAYNPYSPLGFSFSANRLKNNLVEMLHSYTDKQIRVFDVWRDKYDNSNVEVRNKDEY